MLDYLYVNGYKSLVNFRIDFASTSVLIGKNGTGKSSVFEVIRKITKFINGDTDSNGRMITNSVKDLFTEDTYTKWLESDIQTFEMGVSDDGIHYLYRLEVEHGHKTLGMNQIISEELLCNNSTVYILENGITKLFDIKGNKVA